MDHAATTPLDPAVLEAMLPYLQSSYGNPSALYEEGRKARRAIDNARDTVAALIGAASPSEIVFTGSGTESDNLALRGVCEAARDQGAGDHLIVTQIEHHAVLNTAKALERMGFSVTYVPPDQDGIIDPDRVTGALTDRTILVSVMLANNEVGTVQPVQQIAKVCRERQIPMHTDAVQAAGQMPLNVSDLGVDLLSLSGHKVYGPKGVGALYIRKGLPLQPQLTGGGQELERRAGTESVAGIVGLAQALQLAENTMADRVQHVSALRDTLIAHVIKRVEGATLNGHSTQRLPGVVNFSFDGVDGESLLLNLDMHGIAASTGSACSAGSVEPSYVLTAMGVSRHLASQALRLSLGHQTTRDEVKYVAQTLEELVRRLRRTK